MEYIMSTYFFLGDKTAPEGASPLSFPVSSFCLLKGGGPSRTPTRENPAPTSAWSCRHCPQDCAPAALATLGPMPPPPGDGFAPSSPLTLRASRGRKSGKGCSFATVP